MALAFDQGLFLHVPKTGGFWIRQSIASLNIPTEEIGLYHDYFPTLLNYKPKSFFDNRKIFAFVRHPLYWYQSRWAFRMKHGWVPTHPLDWNAASNDFETFVENAIDYKPTGWCTWLYDNYTSGFNGRIDFIGRIENLRADFIEAMKLMDIDVDESRLSPATVNDSTQDGISSKNLARYTPKLIDRVLEVEHEVVTKYYKDFNFGNLI